MPARGWRVVALVLMVAACGDDDAPTMDAGRDAMLDAVVDAPTDATEATAPDGSQDAASDDANAEDAQADAADAADRADAAMISRVPGLAARPTNATCVAWDDEAEPPAALSLTGCFDANHPDRPLPALIPFEPIAKLWSDNAQKERWLAIPDGTRIVVDADGDFDMPNGTVLVKTFSLFGQKLETRLLVRHPSGTWRGYAYQWDASEADALLLSDEDYLANGKRLTGLGDTQQDWTIPSRAQCNRCHNASVGFSIGLEIQQLNSLLTYPTTNLEAHQLVTLDALGLFDAAQGVPAAFEDLPRLSAFASADPLTARARSYLHVNCSMCHRGEASSCTGDFRFQTPESEMGVCNIRGGSSSMWTSDARILKPGDPEQSIMPLRMRAPAADDAIRMPPLGTEVLDHQGINMIEAWIRSMPACAQ